MNKKAQTVLIYGIMLSLTIIILAIALAPAVNQSTSGAMNSSTDTTLGLDCSNDSISTFDKATCVTVDLTTNFYFIVGLILVGGSILVSKIVFS